MCFAFFLIELKSTVVFPRKLVSFNVRKQFTETIDHAKTCADLFMHNVMHLFTLKLNLNQTSAQPPSRNTRQSWSLVNASLN